MDLLKIDDFLKTIKRSDEIKYLLKKVEEKYENLDKIKAIEFIIYFTDYKTKNNKCWAAELDERGEIKKFLDKKFIKLDDENKKRKFYKIELLNNRNYIIHTEKNDHNYVTYFARVIKSKLVFFKNKENLLSK
jgi:hypothetical protein